jgi:CheY-like chemotaxis protein
MNDRLDAVPSAAVSRTPRATLRILLVDDNRGFIDTFARLLRMQGHIVAIAFTYTAGLDQLRANRPDVLITDLQIGDADGWGLVHEARRFDPFMPIVVVTGCFYPPDTGPSGPRIPVFLKPFAPSELLRHIDACR